MSPARAPQAVSAVLGPSSAKSLPAAAFYILYVLYYVYIIIVADPSFDDVVSGRRIETGHARRPECVKSQEKGLESKCIIQREAVSVNCQRKTDRGECCHQLRFHCLWPRLHHHKASRRLPGGRGALQSGQTVCIVHIQCRTRRSFRCHHHHHHMAS